MYELKDLELKVLDETLAKTFISKYHYSKTCSRIVVAIGEFNGNDLVNCIVFNYCSGREMAQQVMVGGCNDNTLELARMVSIEPKPKNLESYCIAKAFKWLKANMPNIKNYYFLCRQYCWTPRLLLSSKWIYLLWSKQTC